MANRDREPDLFAQELGEAIRLLAEARRIRGLRRGLSIHAFAHEAGIDANRLWHAVTGKGRTLSAKERQRAVLAIHDITRRTMEIGSPGDAGLHAQQFFAGNVVLPSGVLNLRNLHWLAGFPTGDPTAIGLHESMEQDSVDDEGWEMLFRQAEELHGGAAWAAAARLYGQAATRAELAGDAVSAAGCLASQMDALVALGAYQQTLDLIDPILGHLGVPEFRPEQEWSSLTLDPRLVGGDRGLDAFALMVRVAAYCWHSMDQFALAHQAGRNAVRAAQMAYGGGYDSRLADAYHFFAKTVLEEASAGDPVIANGAWGLWRRPNLHLPHWERRAHEALTYLERARSLRPPEDAIWHAHSWRNQMRALSLFAEQDASYQPRLTAALRQAHFHYTDGTAGSPTHFALVSLYVDQARRALRADDTIRDAKRVRNAVAQAIELARLYGADSHATWAWCTEAELLVRNQARGWEEKAKRRVLLSLAGWSQEFESRDSRRTVALASAISIDERDVRQFFDDDSQDLDILQDFPGFDRSARAIAVLHRLKLA